MYPSQYKALVDSTTGAPITVKTLTGEERVLVADILSNDIVHAMKKEDVQSLQVVGRLS